jgi:thiol-disulfide isomerase/thioredoxin
MRLPLTLAAILALTACGQKQAEQPSSATTAGAVPDSGTKGVHRDNKGKVAPATEFTDPDGNPVRIADFKGRPVLVNLWATWCAPCVKELPTLDQLSAKGDVDVLAVSQDSGPHASVVAFMKAHDIKALKPYQDAGMGLSGALGPDTVLPTSILFDASGREVWRYVGELDWTSPEAASLLAEASAATQKG